MRSILVPLLLLAAGAGCARKAPDGFQGYLEGEFIQVASPLAGRVEQVSVAKGDRVEAGAPLFTLERSAELAAQRQAAGQLAAARSRLDDLRKGARPSEMAALEARLAQARAAAELSKLDLDRRKALFEGKVTAASDYDQARLTHERNLAAIEEIAAQIATGRLGARDDALKAAEADVAAAAAALERADWSVAQKAQAAPRAGLVYDTLYRAGEFAGAASPVVTLLPPENLKVRFFVPEAEFSAVKAGSRVRVTLTGRPELAARVSYLSPRPEYTPPVLYNRANRAKLVFMVEAVLDPAAARDLHPGQPVDVALVTP
jgi:HlyD family secretion protein